MAEVDEPEQIEESSAAYTPGPMLNGLKAIYMGWMRIPLFERIVFTPVVVIAALFVLTYQWTPGWWIAFHSSWGATYTSLAVLIFVCVSYRFVARTDCVRHSIEAAAALIASIAIIAAGYWYFYERPGVPKINVKSSIDVWPVEHGRALVRVEADLENVGSTVFSFDNYNCEPKNEDNSEDCIRIEVGQVLPFEGKNRDQLPLVSEYERRLIDKKKSFHMFFQKKWPRRAFYFQKPVGEIEAGESERYYYQALIPCVDGMILAATVNVPKVSNGFESLPASKANPRLVWVSQSLSSNVDHCK